MMVQYCLHNCTDPPDDVTLHLSLTHEQDPEIPELLHLRRANRTAAKTRDEILWSPNWTPSSPRHLEILPTKIMNRTFPPHFLENGQKWTVLV